MVGSARIRRAGLTGVVLAVLTSERAAAHGVGVPGASPLFRVVGLVILILCLVLATYVLFSGERRDE